jgi:hypothetical protein
MQRLPKCSPTSTVSREKFSQNIDRWFFKMLAVKSRILTVEDAEKESPW